MNTLSWTDPRFATVVRRLTARTGLSFRADQVERVELGISRAMARSGVQDVAEFQRLLVDDSEAWDALIAELAVGETYFFREPDQFAFMEEEVLPDLLRNRNADEPLQIWCAACATGEEAYSLAIILHEQGLTNSARILATDVSAEFLAKARRATYADWSLRGAAAARAKRYLRREGDLHILDPRIRAAVQFAVFNLTSDDLELDALGDGKVDLIFCRNALIYFDSETVAAIARRFRAALKDGGWLITGAADPQLEKFAPLRTVVRESGVYYQAGSRSNSPDQPGSMGGRSRRAGRGQRVLNSPNIAIHETPPAKPRMDGESPVQSRESDEKLDRSSQDLLAAAEALVEGRYQEAAERTSEPQAGPAASAIHVQALANLDLTQAEQACAAATESYPLSAHLHYLHATLLLDSDRPQEAAEAARRVVYLDRNLAAAHTLLGATLRQAGDLAGALRAFRNAQELCAAHPPDEAMPLTEGETAASLAQAAESQIEAIEAARGAAS